MPIGSGVQRVYPVGIANALRYLSWGLPSTGLADERLLGEVHDLPFGTYGDERSAG